MIDVNFPGILESPRHSLNQEVVMKKSFYLSAAW